MDIEHLQLLSQRLREAIGRVVVGQPQAVELLLIALLAQGHVLLEGVPGTAKTLLARTFAGLLSMRFARVQFTPDLLPGDLIGTNLFDFQTSSFKLTRGPIFTELLLADEINRTPPKTQAALLEAMQERRVSLDGKTHELGPGFMVVATQNPIEQEGTYPLPEAQLDRFLFKVHVGYPTRDQERALVRLHGQQAGMPAAEPSSPLLDLPTIVQARQRVSQIELHDALVDYIVDLVRATREHPSILSGASPRAAAMMAAAVRARAALHGRPYVIPDDVKALSGPALGHRVLLTPAAQIEGQRADRLVARLLEQLPAPR